MYKQIETERLSIRPIRIADKGFILHLLNTKEWLQFIGDRKVKNNTDAEKYIQNILDNKHFFCSVFELKETKTPIGIITFLYRDNQVFPDIGFAILPQFNKKGYTFEATKKYLEEMIKEKKVNKIIAITLPENINSIRLIKKLGLTYEYQFTDQSEVLHLYALLLDNN